MSNIIPKIDQRSQQDLILELRKLILQYCPEWGNQSDLESDKNVDALIRIFSNMTGDVINRLNQVPEKNFITFLNLIGISPTPPRVAKAPLVFKLKDDSNINGFIPFGTKVSAQPENLGEIIFETQKDLTVIKPSLVRAVSIDPNEDRWSNQDFLFSKEPTGEEAELFKGHQSVIHRLYIGDSNVLNFKEEGTIKLSINLKEGIQKLNVKADEDADEPEVSWYYFGEEGEPVALKVIQGLEVSKFQKSGDILFSKIGAITPKTISGYDKSRLFRNWTNNWIYAELVTHLTDESLMPDIEDINVSLVISNSTDSSLMPDVVLYNSEPLDMTKDFYPFGSKPAINDTFYISSKEAFSKKDAEITINLQLSNENICKHPNTTDIDIAWEYWNGSQWGKLETGQPNEVKWLKTSGEIKFICPSIMPRNINGEDSNWIRGRIIKGNYGVEGYFKNEEIDVPITTSKDGKEVVQGKITVTQAKYYPPTFNPPSIEKLSISYTYSIKQLPEIVISENNFTFADRTHECITPKEYFKPFVPSADLEPALYLAFNEDISNLPVSIFFPLMGDQLGEDNVVAWEYWNGRTWLTLSVNDALKHFTRREILQFTAPGDITKRPLFGTEHYWIRARLEEGSYRVYPKVDAIYSNVVWAHNFNSSTDEILGSSNGERDQIFTFKSVPILPDEEVYIRETLGKGEWIKWEEVNTFSLSNTDSRHYMLDRSSGAITFGDGTNGMIPPAGLENIKCTYKYGGGEKGNVKPKTITQIWDSYSEIDAVTNPVAADGGFDEEEVEQTKIRGPHTLKSQNRGVSCEDIEWLVRETMPQIAKIKCLPTMDKNLNFMPGKATMIVVPDLEDVKPTPSQELLNEIETYLSSKIYTGIADTNASGIDVVGPDYVRVGIDAQVVYTTPESGKMIEGCIIDSLTQFFNPIKGGPENTGWEFGKNLHISEVYSVIKNVPGVDYVTNIAVNSSLQCLSLNLEMLKDGYYKPNITYPRYSSVKSSDNKIVLTLANKLQEGAAVKALQVRGFEENDLITLKFKDLPSRELIVLSVAGDILECQTFDEEPLEKPYPVGSDIEANITSDMTIKSYILNEVSGITFFIKVALPQPRDVVFLGRNDEYASTIPLRIKEVRAEDVFLEEDELIYSGIHLINKKQDLKFSYLLDNDTYVLHDLTNTTTQCKLGEIEKEDREYFAKTTDAVGSDRCPYCFPFE